MLRHLPGENVLLLDSLYEEKISKVMQFGRKKAITNKINTTFDYRNYRKRLSKWAALILNGGGNNAGK